VLPVSTILGTAFHLLVLLCETLSKHKAQTVCGRRDQTGSNYWVKRGVASRAVQYLFWDLKGEGTIQTRY